MPTGECWCGCGQEVGTGIFFKSGHDKVAESAVIVARWGNVPEFLVDHGYGPGGRNAHVETQERRAKG